MPILSAENATNAMNAMNAMNATIRAHTTTEMLTPRYRLVNRLGAGGMGEVYRAFDRLTGQMVAIKRLSLAAASTQLRIALSEEFQMLSGLRHPHIVTVNNYGFEASGHPFYTMELLERPGTLIEAGHLRSDIEKIDLLVQLLQALSYLHRCQVVHRDIKPGNVLVQERQVKLLDLGLATIAGQSTASAGTLLYMAPEVLRGEAATTPSDLYAVGLLGYELFAGWHPFASISTPTIEAILHAEIDWEYAEIPPQFLGILQRLLAQKVTDRFPNAASVLEAFSAASRVPIVIETSSTRESFLQAAPFVGRHLELQRLTEALNATIAGHANGWLIGGESGVGKSRLLGQLRTHALVQGVHVVRGQATTTGGVFHLWAEPLRWLTVIADISDSEASVLKPLVPGLERVLEQRINDAPMLTALATEQRLYATVGELLRRATQQQPLLLLFEDLQWADGNSLDLLRWIFERQSQGQRLLIVADYRSDEMPNLPATLPSAHLLQLERLPTASLGQLSEAILGSAGLQPHLLDYLQRESEGNTFFVVELLRTLAEEAGWLDRVGEMPLPKQIFPGGIRQLVQRRLQRIPEHHHPLLETAAVAGRQLDLQLLLALAGEIDLEVWLTQAVNSSVLEVQEGRWRFNHDKLREAILLDLSQARRIQLHGQIATTIETVYSQQLADHYGDLAYHFRHAAMLESERHYLHLAAQQAKQLYANSAATDHFERLLAITLYNDERAEVQCDLGQVLKLVGRWNDAENLFRQAYTYAEEKNDSHLLVRTAQLLGGLARSRGDNNIALNWLTHARDLCMQLNDRQQLCEVLSEIGNVHYQQGDYANARTFLEEALALAEESDDKRMIGLALHCLGNVYFDSGDYKTTRAFYNRALVLRRQLDDAADIASTINNLAILSWYEGNLERALHDYEESLRLRQAVGDRAGVAVSLSNRGIIFKEQGNPQAAMADYEAALAINQELGNKTAICYVNTNIAALHLDAGDFVLARAIYEETLSLRQQLGDRWGIASTLSHLGNVAIAQSDTQSAIDYYRQSLSLLRTLGDKQKIMYCLVGLSAAAGELNQHQRAVQLAAAAATISQQQKLTMETDTHLRFEENVSKLRQRISAPAFDEAWRSGMTLSIEKAIELGMDV